jgi:hypothetical protein
MKIRSPDCSEYPKITTTCFLPPMITQSFNRKFLWVCGWKLEKILKLIEFLKRKISSKEFNKFPASQNNLLIELQFTLEIYELAKQKESQKKEGSITKADGLFYKPELDSKADIQIYGRLERRASCSESDRRRNEI